MKKRKPYFAKASKGNKKYSIVAIDESGRGPLAGPISVAAIAATDDSQLKLLKNIRDSKKLSEKQREEWFAVLKNNFEYRVSMVGSRIIDRVGIKRATQVAVNRVLCRLLHGKLPDVVLLDGLLKAPKRYSQQTIIKGDEKVPLISAASIMAKVKRDRKMRRVHESFPEYFFDRHKGYGTKLHYAMIKKHGRLSCHRDSFLKNVAQK